MTAHRTGRAQPEKAGVGGSIPSLATLESVTYRPPDSQFHSNSFQFQKGPPGFASGWICVSGGFGFAGNASPAPNERGILAARPVLLLLFTGEDAIVLVEEFVIDFQFFARCSAVRQASA